MTQSEEDILTALICQHVQGTYNDHGTYRLVGINIQSARAAAKKIIGCGFEMTTSPVDDRQDGEIDALEIQVQQLRGWAGLPPELR